jgi:hypothetical protein
MDLACYGGLHRSRFMRTETETQQFLSIVTLFNLDDPAELFMLKVICRYHTETPSLCTMAEIRRVVREIDGRRHRIILSATRFQPRHKAARPQWDLIAWNVDDVSIRFYRQPGRKAATAAVRRGKIPSP